MGVPNKRKEGLNMKVYVIMDSIYIYSEDGYSTSINSIFLNELDAKLYLKELNKSEKNCRLEHYIECHTIKDYKGNNNE